MNLSHAVRYAILFGFIAFWLPVFGQLPGMKVYTQLDGYPGTTGYLIHQDEKGFIWIGTDNGAVRFDGKRFKVFDDRLGLMDKEILIPQPSKNGIVVFLPLLNNLSYYDNGKVITASQDKRLNLIKSKTINYSYHDTKTGVVWVADNYVDSNVLAITKDSIWTEKIKLGKNVHILAVKNNKFYLHQSDGNNTIFGIYSLATKKFDTLYHSYGKYSWGYINEACNYLVVHFPFANRMEAIEIGKNGTTKKLWQYTTKNNVGHAIIDKNYHLWIAYENGGIDYHGLITDTTTTLKPLFFLDDINLNYIFVDKDNNKWFTTKDKGLFFISAKHWENALLAKKLNLPKNIPLSVEGDNYGRVYIGYNKPMISVIENGTTKKIELDAKYFGKGVSIIKNLGTKICFSSRTNLNLYKVDQTQISLLHNFDVSGESIKDLMPLDNNRMLIATHISLNIIPYDEKYLDIFTPPFYSGRTTSACSVGNDIILIGTPNGLYKQIGKHGKAKPSTDTLLSAAHITDIVSINNDYALVGTSVKGIFSYHIATGKARQIGKNNNPGSSYIRQIFLQNDTLCWLATDRGVFKIRFDKDLNEKEVEQYSFFDGLPSTNTLGVYVKQDTLYVAAAAGMCILPLKSVTHKSQPSVGWISSVQVGDSTYYFPKVLHLNHSQNDVQVSLSTISYESIGNTKYRYKLEGLSDNWLETESPDISFSGLAPGNYKLLISAVNFKGVKSEHTVVLPIIITPAFWQTDWFMWAVIVLVALIVFFIIFRIVVSEKNKQYRKMQQERRLAELELEAIKAQINPHFIYNCLNSIQYFSYKNDYEPVNRYLDLFAKLIRQTMQFSQETFITLGEELDYLANYLSLEKIRFKEKLIYNIQVDQNIAVSTLVPSMMIQPYIENALKHGIAKLNQPGKIWLSVSQTPKGWLKITVEDNGPGLKHHLKVAEKGKLGLRLAGNRAVTYNQLFELDIRINVKERGDENSFENGVKVELLIPPITHENKKF